MTLADLGNLGEFIGSIGVVISLVYVGLQIRQNTEATRDMSAQNLTAAVSQTNLAAYSSEADHPFQLKAITCSVEAGQSSERSDAGVGYCAE